MIQAKDAVIQELKERVAYLEAEVRLSGAVPAGARGLLRAQTLSLKPPGVTGLCMPAGGGWAPSRPPAPLWAERPAPKAFPGTDACFV